MSDDRKRMLGHLHQLKAQQGLDDDTYRDKLERLTGKRSAAALDEAQLREAIEAFGGFHVKQNANNPHTAKIKALWIAAWNLGVLDSGTDKTLDAFCERQTGRSLLRFVGPDDAGRVTEALKDILARNGCPVPSADRDGVMGRRNLLLAQWNRLHQLGEARVSGAFGLDGYVRSRKVLTFHGGHIHLTTEQADRMSRELGDWIRSVQKAKAKAATG